MKTGFLLNKSMDEVTRLAISTGLAGLVLLFLPSADLGFRILASWSTGTLCFLLLILLMITGATPEKTRYRAQRQKAKHLGIVLLVVFTAFTSLFVIGAMLANNKDTFTPKVALSIVAILCSWLLMQTMFALHYAAFYYQEDNLSQDKAEVGGLQFASEEPPNYWDFMYFTFTLGMTSQTSDTALTSSAMRRLALGHTVVSFFFYSVILALTVSIVCGLI